MKRAELEKLLASCGLGEAYVEQEALFLWSEVVGPRLELSSTSLGVHGKNDLPVLTGFDPLTFARR